jgi:hypothetical protein
MGTITHRLGRNCVLSIDGQVFSSVVDVFRRVTTEERRVSARNQNGAGRLVVGVQREIEFRAVDTDELHTLHMWLQASHAFSTPVLYTVECAVPGYAVDAAIGLTWRFAATLHGGDIDEPLAEKLSSRFVLAEWSGPKLAT